MEFIKFILLGLLAALGPIIGFVVSFYVKDELKKGRFLVEMALKLVLLAIVVIVLVSKLDSYTEIVIILALVIFQVLKSPFLYLTYGVLLFTSSFNPEVAGSIYMLTFIYFLFDGALKKQLKQVVINSLLFLITSLVAYGAWSIS